MLNLINGTIGKQTEKSNSNYTKVDEHFGDILSNFSPSKAQKSNFDNKSNIVNESKANDKIKNTQQKNIRKKVEDSRVNPAFDLNIKNRVDNNSPKTKENIKVENTEDSTENTTEKDDKEITKDKIIIEIANLLGIQPEKVQDALNELEISPEQLYNNGNVLEFAKKVFEVETNSDLLNINGIKETLDEIKNILETSTIETNVEPTNDKDNTQNIKNTIENIPLNTDIFVTDKPDINELAKNVPVNNTAINNLEKNTKDEIVIEEIVQEGDIAEQKISLENIITDEKNIVANNNNIENENSSNDFINNPNEDIFGKEVVYSHVSFQSENNFENILVNKTSQHNQFKSIDHDNVIEQIMNQIKVDPKDTNTVRITLHPETLGDVSLKVSTQNGVVTAQFVAENEKVKQIIEAGFNNLKEALAGQGVNISSLSVSVGQEQNENSQKFFEQSTKSQHRIEDILESQKILFQDESALDNYDLDANDASVNYIA